jgi:class 3 adenylate cyclase/predicted ATPase
MDLGQWLRSLGLERYEAAFRENEIDETVLPALTADDLKELGVAALGHRRKLLDAIAALRAQANEPPPSETRAIIDRPANEIVEGRRPGPIATAGERRHITVMFCDLVDSTGISAKLDPEEWRDLVGAYLDAASAAVAEMGGHVAKKLGDGLMALFGYPMAQENDSERATRSALAILRALSELNRKNTALGKPALAARIAVESGPVVVDAAGEIFGDAPNVAARVQALAEPGAVVVTARVQRQVAGLFVVEERGSHHLKGLSEPVMLFRIVRASGGGRRSGQRRLTPLVGRGEEIALLMQRWERARQGDGQLVQIVGEPGLGKSRLIEEFHSRLRETPHTWVEWSCSQLLQNTPLHPVTEWGRIRFGGGDVPAEQRLADLENTLMQVKLSPADNIPLLAPLLDIPLPQDRALALDPEELRHRQLAAMTAWVMAGARTQAVVLAIEDLHWADPTTLDLLRGIAERGALAPLFVLLTGRPEFRPPWGIRSHHSTISLAPLDRHQVRHMVSELTSRHVLPSVVIEGVAERSGGVPLFVEEVTLLLLERGQPAGIQAIPPTLQQSLAARLDRLGPAREVAQIAAMIGRDFSYTLLRAVAGVEHSALQSALERLAEADLLLVQGLAPDSSYRFKHALIQNAAYENLLKSRRQALHRRVAEALRDNVSDVAAAEPELLAHHFTQAGLTEAAAEWWGKAGQRSLERSALIEAVEQLTRALGQYANLPATPALRREEIKLQAALVNALMHTKGYAAPETTTAEERARSLIETAEALGEPPEDPLLMFSVLYGFWVANQTKFNGDVVCELAAQFLGAAERQRTISTRMMGHRLMGSSLLCTGQLVQGREHLDRAIELYNPDQHRVLTTRFGHDPRVAILFYRSWALWALGYPDAALADIEGALTDAREIGHAATLMVALAWTSPTQYYCGNYSAVNAQAEELLALADEKGAMYWKAAAMCTQGLFLHQTGRASEAVQKLKSGIAAWRATGASLLTPTRLSWLAAPLAELGQFDDAWRCLDEAIAAIETSKECWYEAEVNRIAGEVALKSPEPDAIKATAYFGRALTVARAQRAKSWELRAAMSLARLWREQGRQHEARDLLAPIYGWFSQGFDTLDLRQAKALLAEFC